VKVTGPLWYARKRRKHAVDELEHLWTCWYLFFRYLHRSNPPGPIALAESQFTDLVGYHERMVRMPRLWWLD
jgi:hypothetical protein